MREYRFYTTTELRFIQNNKHLTDQEIGERLGRSRRSIINTKARNKSKTMTSIHYLHKDNIHNSTKANKILYALFKIGSGDKYEISCQYFKLFGEHLCMKSIQTTLCALRKNNQVTSSKEKSELTRYTIVL